MRNYNKVFHYVLFLTELIVVIAIAVIVISNLSANVKQKISNTCTEEN